MAILSESEKKILEKSSSFLGRGRTKTEYLESAFKLMVQVFIREPMENKSGDPKEEDNVEAFEDAKDEVPEVRGEKLLEEESEV